MLRVLDHHRTPFGSCAEEVHIEAWMILRTLRNGIMEEPNIRQRSKGDFFSKRSMEFSMECAIYTDG